MIANVNWRGIDTENTSAKRGLGFGQRNDAEFAAPSKSLLTQTAWVGKRLTRVSSPSQFGHPERGVARGRRTTYMRGI